MRKLARILAAVAIAALVSVSGAARASGPTSVTIAGSLQSELGCSGDWQPDCALTHLAYDASDDVWQKTFHVPAGSFEYKGALNDSWAESYGLHAGGDNIPLSLGAARDVKFYYDHKSHWVTDNVNSVIAVAPGSFQSELGCPGDWDPGCLRSWLEDRDGDGVYTFETTALPAGSYEGKVALNESWDVNYGAGGIQNGPNIPFTVPVDHAKVVFSYDSGTHVLSIHSGHGHDGNVEWDGLRHDSRDTTYRTPAGAVPAGTPVTLRFRTFHDDVTAVKLRLYDVEGGGQRILPMQVAASNVSCYQVDLAAERCDFWQVTLPNGSPDTLWYRFIVSDGSKTAYYADDTSALDGGLGAPSNDQVDSSWALTVYVPGFAVPAWARSAVIYQIFPDRFANGDKKNDPKTGDKRYDDPVLALPWGTLPEGYCRSYAQACPARFGGGSPEAPRGRDYMGGDLKGIRQKLEYLKAAGFNAIYLNPIFWAKSNHRYDTADYKAIDPALGDLKEFEKVVKQAHELGMHIILDGVFNHMSSDSPNFDRYHHYATVGACESLSSPYRDWFYFKTNRVPCGTADYTGWFNFDSIPVLKKTNPAVQDYFVTGSDSVARYWLREGADAWRMDVMGDPSFPDGYWLKFRQVVKSVDPDALIISELWQKDTTLLRFLRGERADTTMNYRLRDAVLSLLAPGSFDPKGFSGSGNPIAPSKVAARLLSQQEDYAPAAYSALMNLVDSHDTARIRWTLTPGAETTADKEQNAGNVAEGKRRQRLASLLQYTMPGAPTVYYGDEVGMTGADDPDDRRTYPWPDTGGKPDQALLAHYTALAALRSGTPALVSGSLRVLAADDAKGVLVYGRKTESQAAVVAINRSPAAQALDVPVSGWVPDGTAFAGVFGVENPTGGSSTATGGVLHVELAPLSGLVLATGTVDLTPPPAPAGVQADATSGSVALTWSAAAGATAYNVYCGPLTGGGYVKANAATVTGTSFTVTGLRNAQTAYCVVRSLDAAGNESGDSSEASAVPHYTIGWANTQWPPTLSYTLSPATRTGAVYGQVWIDGVTNQPGPTDGLLAQLGFGPPGSDPSGNADWTWTDAAFNTDAGSNDEYVASMRPTATGSYDYAYRYSTTNGAAWTYADLDGIQNGYSPAQAGKLTVIGSGDTIPPATPGGLHVTGASPTEIDLAWNPVLGDPTLYGYEVLRSGTAGGPYKVLGLVTDASYADTSVTQGSTYYYVVRAVDLAFNRSGNSNEVSQTAAPRTVHLVFTATVPAATDGTGLSVHIAGTLDRLDGGLPQWDPGATALTRVDPTHWTITLTGSEATQIEYKYTLGDWDHVEKDGSCGEIGNRQLTLGYGSTGTQTVNDVVLNWRNVAPCGN